MNKITREQLAVASEIAALHRRIAEQEVEIYKLAREQQEQARVHEATIDQIEGVLRKRCERLEARAEHAEEWALAALRRCAYLEAQR